MEARWWSGFHKMVEGRLAVDDVDAEAQETFAHEPRRFFVVGAVDFPDRWKVIGVVFIAVRERLDPQVGVFKGAGVADVDDEFAVAEASAGAGEFFEEGEFIHRFCVVVEVSAKVVL